MFIGDKMNKKEKLMEIDKNRKLYTIPSGAAYQQRVKNAIHISPSNSVSHELGKALGAYMLRKYGDLKFSDSINQALKWIEEEVKEVMKEFPKEKANFITECVPKSEPNRRVDLVRLEDDQRFEFETNPKIKKDNACTVYLKPKSTISEKKKEPMQEHLDNLGSPFLKQK